MRVLVHATAVALGRAAEPFGGRGDVGVLIMGESGAGKSDVALRLIAMGAQLLSDDQTALYAHEGQIYAEAPPSLSGLMEVRGVGIVNLAPAPPAPLVLAVHCELASDIPRMPDHANYRLPEALQSLPSLPLIVLHPVRRLDPGQDRGRRAAAAGKFG